MPSPDCTVAKQGVYEGYEDACRSYGFLVSLLAYIRLSSKNARTKRDVRSLYAKPLWDRSS